MELKEPEGNLNVMMLAFFCVFFFYITLNPAERITLAPRVLELPLVHPPHTPDGSDVVVFY